MHRNVTLIAKKRSNKLKYLKLEENEKLQKKLLYSFKRSFQLGDKQFRVIYTLIAKADNRNLALKMAVKLSYQSNIEVTWKMRLC